MWYKQLLLIVVDHPLFTVTEIINNSQLRGRGGILLQTKKRRQLTTFLDNSTAAAV